MPWTCPGCGIQREPAGTNLATAHEYCTQGIPFTPINPKKCCKCRGKSTSSMCSPCASRARGGSGSSSGHHSRINNEARGLCRCGRSIGHDPIPGCSVRTIVAYTSKCGEGKVPLKDWGPRLMRVTGGVVRVVGGDITALASLALEERKIMGDPRVKGLSKIIGILECDPDAILDEHAELLENEFKYIVNQAKQNGYDEANGKIEDWLQDRVSQGVGMNCPRGHRLKRFTTSHNGYSCDNCGDSCRRGVTMHGCRKCDYDLCYDCGP